ncbi:Hypp1705 [Branchiostoma lanceolatum]|uniref:Hypp1705 protein n=1 Tax=Branchiostoma lanceolatum TaxID=7740 RepID=A0A8K0EJU0_BRALA|nr:Hypp1705 [Branchiostoma lanceolatum]
MKCWKRSVPISRAAPLGDGVRCLPVVPFVSRDDSFPDNHLGPRNSLQSSRQFKARAAIPSADNVAIGLQIAVMEWSRDDTGGARAPPRHPPGDGRDGPRGSSSSYR